MPNTSVRGRQLRDDDVTRADLNVTTSGSAVIRRVIAGSGVSISSTGADSGTGDVTITLSGSSFSGSGTTNYVTKWTGTNALGISQIFDDGTKIGIGTATPTAKFHIEGSIRSNVLEDQLFTFPVGSATYRTGLGFNAPFTTFDGSTSNFFIFSNFIISQAKHSGGGSNALPNYSIGAISETGGLNSVGPIYGIGGYFATRRRYSDDVSENSSNQLIGITARVFTDPPASASINNAVVYSVDAALTLNTGINNFVSPLRGGGSIGTSTSSNATTVTDYAGLRLSTTVGSSTGGAATITTYYGILINQPTINTSGSITNRWSIYSADTVSPSYIAGNLLIGTTTNGSYKVDISGTLRNSDSAYFATTSGSVGIGTTTPTFLSGTGLHIKVSGDAVMRVTAGARTGFDVSQETVGGLVYLYNRDNTDIIIGINDGEKARFKANGQFILHNLSGTGTRMVVAGSDGTLSTQTLPSAGATASGTTNYLSKFTSASALGDSQLFDNGTNIGVGNNNPQYKLHFAIGTGNIGIFQQDSKHALVTNAYIVGTEYHYGAGTVYGYIYAHAAGLHVRTMTTVSLVLGTNNLERARITSAGNFGIGTDSPTELVDVNGRIRARTIDTHSSPTFYLTADANGVIQRSSGLPSSGVSGTGTANYIPKWTSTTGLGNSVIYDAGGANVGVAIGHTTPYSPGGHASLHIGGYNSGRGLITFGWGATSAGPVIYSSNDDSLTISSNSYVWAGSQLRTTKLIVNSSTDTGHDAQVNGSLAVTGFIRIYRDSGYGTKNIIVNDDGFVFMQMQSNDQIRIPRPTNFDSTVRFGAFEWYPNYVSGSNRGQLRIAASSNGGTDNDHVFWFEGELRSQNYRGALMGFTGTITIGTAEVVGYYYAPSTVTGTTSNHYAWWNTVGNIRFGNLAGSGTRMVVADSNGVLSTQAIPSGGGGNTIYSGDGTLSGQRVITGAGNNIRLSNGGLLVSNTANTQRVDHLFDGIYSVGVDLTLFAPTSQNLIFYSGNGPAGRFTASKKLLIGTSAETGDDAAILVVGGFGTDATIQMGGSSTGYSSLYMGDGSGADRYAGYVQYYHQSNELYLGTASNTRLTINSSGNVGIGTTSPTERLHVVGTAIVSNSRAFASGGNYGQSVVNTVTIPGGSSFGTGAVWAGTSSANLLTYGGSSTVPNAVNLGGVINVSRSQFSSAGQTITFTQGSNSSIRALAALTILQQTDGTESGTISHGTGILMQGIYPLSTGNVTYTNYYGLAINPLDEWGGVTITNRWAIYQIGASDKNYFRGRVLLNTTSDAGYQMDVNGSVRVSSLEVNGALTHLRSFNRRTSDYTLALSDAGKVVEMNIGTANTLTIPADGTINFPVGSYIDVVQYGAGQTAIAGAGGVTVRSNNNWLKLNARYSGATLIKVAANEWYVLGNLSA